tara:strand:+ start:194 stop:1063 length:870 start_codon:yes stop_codon:yes gene_type:complete
MKQFISTVILCAISIISFSQAKDTTEVDTTIIYKIIKTDGDELIGKILSQDEREVYFLTKDNRKIYVPQYVIKEIIALSSSDFNNNGSYVGEDPFSTRYFISTNGLPIKKGDHYVQFNLYGPDFQFGVGNNLSVGITTTWIGIPLVGSIKKSWEISKNAQFAVGALVGTGSWAAPTFAGALPFGSISFGNRSRNIAFTAGYGAIFGDGETKGRAMTSIAGMIKVSNKLSLVFDSFILLPGQTETYALLIPGLRWHQSSGKALQFGFTAIVNDYGLLPLPIPTIQWYRKL